MACVPCVSNPSRLTHAIAVLEKAAAAKPSDEDVAIDLARLYDRSGDFLKAEGVLAARLHADPTSIAVGTAMAQQYFLTGRAQDAKKLFADVLARRPDHVVALLALAQIATAARNWPEATDYIRRARTAAPIVAPTRGIGMRRMVSSVAPPAATASVYSQ